MTRACPLALCALLVGCGDPPARPHRTPTVRSTTAELRPTDTSSGIMWKFQPGDVVESWGVDGGSYLVHFTRAGVNAVPPADPTDAGVPDFVRGVAQIYEEVGALYHGPLGFRRPLSDQAVSPNGGDARFDVYLLDFARAADGAFRTDRCLTSNPDQCIGYVVQENDFAGYGYPSSTEASRILGSHEYFHGVQAAYDGSQDAVVSEGTAVWATERFDPASDDFENFIDGYLADTDRSIDSPPPGPVPSFAYGSAIFFRFLSERFDDAIILKLWEHLENGQGDPAEPGNAADPSWVIQLDALLKRDYASSFAAAFAEFATWNLYLGAAADPARSYAEGANYPQVTFTSVTAPYSTPTPLRFFYASAQYFEAPAGGRARMTAAMVNSAFTTEDDVEGLVLVLAARKAGRITEAVRLVTGAESVDVAGGAGVLVVINTLRGQVGASLSRRPHLCLGDTSEVAACVAGFGGQPPDAGQPDAGPSEPPDAGPEPDAGVDPGPPPGGCGCGMSPGATLLVALAGLWVARRRSSR